MTTRIKPPEFKNSPLVLALQAALASGVALPTTPIWAAQTTRVTVSSTGVQATTEAYYGNSSISADGRFVTFQSPSTNLVSGDTNDATDIFVRDLATNQTTRVSLNSVGEESYYNKASGEPSISADGRYVAFRSSANNFVSGDTNSTDDIFVRDRITNTTTRVSLSSAGVQANGYSSKPSISANGRYIAFKSRANNLVLGDTNLSPDIFVHDRVTKQTTRVSVDNTGVQKGYRGSDYPSISANGRFVAFQSEATELVVGDTNSAPDIFVHDRATHLTTRVSVNSANEQANFGVRVFKPSSISADGRFVAFCSDSTNLVAGDTNGLTDIFIRDRATNQTTRVSVNSNGDEAKAGFQVYGSFSPSISADGRFVAFYSDATNLVTNDINGFGDVFVRDRATKQTTLISLSSANVQGNSLSNIPLINADGRYVAFTSFANNLVAKDTAFDNEVFVRDRLLTPAITADLAITQTVSANPVTVGASFSYTATVKNLGPGNATNVVLSDFAPLSRVSLPPTLTPSQGTCYRGSISICRLGTINAGQQATVQMTFTARGAGIVANRVTVSASPKDPTPFNSVTTNTKINP